MNVSCLTQGDVAFMSVGGGTLLEAAVLEEKLDG